MRKLVLILIAFIAVITFIKALDNSNANSAGKIFPGTVNSAGTKPGEFNTGEAAQHVVR